MINRMTRLVLAGLALGAPLLAGAEPLRIAPSVPHPPPTTNTFSLTREVDEAHSAIGGYVTGFGRGMTRSSPPLSVTGCGARRMESRRR